MKPKLPALSGLLIVSIIWLLAAVSDRIWFSLDRSVPAWDHADYLNSALDYWRIWQQPQWFSGDWWSRMWMLSPKVPPLTYLLTIPFQNLFGTGADQTNLVHLLFSAILFGSVYQLGTVLFNRSVGLWAVGLCVLLPGLYQHRLQFLLDYPVAAMVTLSFYGLTMWRLSTSRKQWFWAVFFGFSFGLGILTKQTTLFFLFTPLLWAGIATIKNREWGRLAQLLTACLLSVVVFFPWARTNWLLMLTSGKRATVDSAIAEGDPALTSLDAWLYYWKLIPAHVSWPLLIIPIVGFLLFIINKIITSEDLAKTKIISLDLNWNALKWLGIFWIGGYLICSLNINKDFRYTLPLLPVFSIFLAYGLTLFPRRWGRQIRWGTIGLGLILMTFNLWPIGSYPVRQVMRTLNPGNQHHVYLGNPWPNEAVIAEMIQAEPYLESNLGVIPSTPEINQHNLNYYGSLRDSQVYGRQVGTKEKNVLQDVRSLSWFITKTGQQGSVDRIQNAQDLIIKTLENSPEFKLKKQWFLPDNSLLNLYQRITPFVQIEPLPKPVNKVQLGNILIPEKTPPGVPVPVTYDWRGSLDDLKSGLVMLTWEKEENSSNPQQTSWLHDHGIGMGQLYNPLKNPEKQVNQSYQVVERIAMLPPANLIPGDYQLKAIYLNRETGEAYPISTPKVTLKIDPKATPLPAPELDLVTQLRTLSINLPQGIKGLDPIFAEVGRINQYDPTQDYTIQAEKTLEYRLKQEPNRLDFAYNLALANVLQQDAPAAIQALTQVAALDPKNSNAHAYLAFIYLYNLQPKQAETALKPALELNPNQPEFQVLKGVSALMQGHLIQAWQDLKALNQI